MEIKINHDITSAARAEMQARVTRPAAAPAERAMFEGARRLDEALASVPEVRPDEVQRAKDLVNLVQYPPEETMRKLARLLAMEFERNS